MGNTLKRFNSIRRSDDVGDQHDSGAISGAVATAETQEQFQAFFLSRLRQVIFGESAPEHWYDDLFSAGILSLRELSAAARVGVPLAGPLNGHNRTFKTAPDYFVHDLSGTGRTIELWHNGRRLIQTNHSHPGSGDFWVEESAGAGTGFDTVNLLTFAPVGTSTLLATYYTAL
jgi:hypothetical protein